MTPPRRGAVPYRMARAIILKSPEPGRLLELHYWSRELVRRAPNAQPNATVE